MGRTLVIIKHMLSLLRIGHRAWMIPCALLVVVVIVFSVGGDTNRFTLGFIGNFESINAQPQIEALSSVELAFEEFKRQYSDSFNLKILPVDDSKDPEVIKRAYEKIKHECDVILFVTNSTAFLAVYNEVHKNPKVLHLAVGPTTTVLSGLDDNVIRYSIDMDAEQRCIADFLSEKKIETLLVVRETEKNAGYTRMANSYFRKYYKGDIVETTFSAIDIDLKETIEKLKKGDFKYVYLMAGGVPREIGIVAQNICRIKPRVQVIITPWARGPFLLEAVGRYGANLVIPSPLMLAWPNEEYRYYEELFVKKHGGKPGYFAPLTYDMITILLKAIYECGNTEVECLKRSIMASATMGTTGKIQFNQYGDVEGRVYFYKVSDAGYELLK